MIRMLLSAGMIVLLAIGVAHAAGDSAAGKVKAAGCVGCHGANGQGIRPIQHWLAKAKISFSRPCRISNRASAAMR